MSIFRNRIFLKILTAYVILTHLVQIFTPQQAYALTSGPTQPEVQGFTPVGTSEMVDLASGNFSYNIPLMDVGGYPINLSYDAGATGMDAEASMVGLGWMLNIGHMGRSLRGIPDDFNGETISKEFNLKENRTWGINTGFGIEIAGFESDNFGVSLSTGLGMYHNSYKGMGFEFSIDPSMTAGNGSSGSLSMGLGLNFNSQSGVNVSPSVSYNYTNEGEESMVKKENGSTSNFFSVGSSIGAQYNSREGLKGMSMGMSFSSGKKYYVPKKGDENEQKGGDGVGLNNTATIDFTADGSSPQLTLPFKNYSFSLKGTLGLEFTAVHPNFSLGGYYSRQYLPKNSLNYPSFGYLYTHHAKEAENDGEGAMLDFGRDKDGPYYKNATPFLPSAHMNYDVFTASGHGVGGSFRAHRSDWGMVYDPAMRNDGIDASAGLELGGGNGFRLGGNITFNDITSTSGRWSRKNKLRNKLDFMGASQNSDEPDYEPFYFKSIGEKTVETDQTFYTKVVGDSAVRPKLTGNPVGVASGALTNGKGLNTPPSENSYYRINRERRNQAFSFLTAAEASVFGLDTALRSYAYNSTFSGGVPDDTLHSRRDTHRKDHHISEITVSGPDGKRYVYGIPAYNTLQREVSFNAAGLTPDANNEITYQTGDNESTNTRGRDHFFSAQETPGYAHSYLLTAVLTPDYVDATQNGPSDDDLGGWVRINHTRISDDFDWRTPYGNKTAGYTEGFKTKPLDDKASYVYGQKEVWYPHSIETRHYVAEFEYDSRTDGLGVKGEDGDKETNDAVKKLVSITLYGKKDRLENGADARVVKKVHFNYDNTLCSGILNGTTGKLTLTSLFFTYGTSERARFSPYTFIYADYDTNGTTDPQYNPSYSPKAYDRWTNYMPKDSGMGDLPTWEYPYSDQREIPSGNDWDLGIEGDRFADAYSRVYKLSSIELPSGGKINISYESDDYAYVQDKPAMQMCSIEGSGELYSSTPAGTLYEGKTSHNWLFVNLPQKVTHDSLLEKYYLKGILGSKVYISTHLEMTGDRPNVTDKYEQIGAYAAIDSFTLINDSLAGLKLRTVSLRDNDNSFVRFNPIVKRGWDMLRMSFSEHIYPGSDPVGTGESALLGLVGMLADIKTMFTGVFNMLIDRDFCKHYDPSKSWVRLSCPDGMKHGGDYRVRQISMVDNWNQMGGTGAEAQTLGQEYDYTMTELGRTISSGVAANEPQVGGDENPLRMPYEFEVKKALAKNIDVIIEGPIMESQWPSPQVVYSRVTVRDLSHAEVNKHGTGKVVSEYYTARDYPVQVKKTEEKVRNPSKFSLVPFDVYQQDLLTVSQGFAIYLNDMHGKPKSQMVYAENKDVPLSGVEYFYRENAPGQLDNEDVQVIYADNTKGTATVGKMIDFVVDEREQQTRTTGFQIQGNFDFFVVGIIPIPLPTVWPKVFQKRIRTRTITASKVIHSSGILDKVVAFDGSAAVATQNLAWDAETGEVLLTRTTNEFNDFVFNFSYPSHWAYPQTGGAYQNMGAEWTDATLATAFADNLLVKGDELMIYKNGSPQKGWVLDTDLDAVIHEDGTLFSDTTFTKIKVLRSGYRNQQAGSVGSLTTRDNPLGTTTVLASSPSDVLAAGAAVMDDETKMYCGVPEIDTLCQVHGLSQEIQDFLSLLNAMVADGTWLDASVNITDSSFYTSTLKDAFDADPGCTTTYKATVTDVNGCSREVDIEFEVSGGGCTTHSCEFEINSDPNTIFCLEYWSRFDSIQAVHADTGCSGTYDFTLKGIIDIDCDGGSDIVETFSCTNTCFFIEDRHFGPLAQYPCADTGAVINPFLEGLRGNWAPRESYAYLTGRTGSLASSGTNIRTEGMLSGFSYFWQWTGSAWEPVYTGWQTAANITRWSPFGYNVEEKDPLDRYSAALYGYSHQLPIAMGANAQYKEIAYANFEEIEDVTISCDAHLAFNHAYGGDSLELTENYAHTGHRSAILPAGEYLAAYHPITTGCVGGADRVPYRMKECDCIGYFGPEAGTKYVASYWLRTDIFSTLGDDPVFSTDYDTVDLEIYVDNALITPAREVRSRLIDGWQRVEQVFTIPDTATDQIIIKFANDGAYQAYLDDFRIHPFLSGLKTYVYDEVNLRLMAEGDGQGYYTFYQYDPSGALVSVKKETERGIVTLQEHRTHMVME